MYVCVCDLIKLRNFIFEIWILTLMCYEVMADLMLDLVFSITVLNLKSGNKTFPFQDTTSCSVCDRAKGLEDCASREMSFAFMRNPLI